MHLTGAIDQLAGGQQTVTISYANHVGEIGVMARAVLVLKQNTLEKLRLGSGAIGAQTAKRA